MTVADDLATLRQSGVSFARRDAAAKRVEAEVARLASELEDQTTAAMDNYNAVVEKDDLLQAAEAEVARLERDNAVLRELPSRETVRRAEAAEAEAARLRDGLRQIIEIKESGYGSSGWGTDFYEIARALLAEDGAALTAGEPPRGRDGTDGATAPVRQRGTAVPPPSDSPAASAEDGAA